MLSQVKAQLGEAGDLLTKQVPEAGARVGQGTAEALKGAASNSDVGNPVKEALDSLEQVGYALLQPTGIVPMIIAYQRAPR